MDLRHNYKLLPGTRKSTGERDLLSSHYSTLVLMIIDAKEMLKEYNSVELCFRDPHIKICTLDCDGGVEWHTSEEEMQKQADETRSFWNKRAEHYESSSVPGDEKIAKERRYLARVYPDILMMEYRLIKAEVTR